MNKHLRIPLLASLREQTPFPPLVACVAGTWKYWTKERTGARSRDTRVSFSLARFFLRSRRLEVVDTGYVSCFTRLFSAGETRAEKGVCSCMLLFGGSLDFYGIYFFWIEEFRATRRWKLRMNQHRFFFNSSFIANMH